MIFFGKDLEQIKTWIWGIWHSEDNSTNYRFTLEGELKISFNSTGKDEELLRYKIFIVENHKAELHIINSNGEKLIYSIVKYNPKELELQSETQYLKLRKGHDWVRVS